MAWEATDISLRVLKESNKSRFNRYSVRNSVLIIIYPILPFGIVACTFFVTTFLKIAVYTLYVVLEENFNVAVDSGYVGPGEYCWQQ